MNQRAGWLYNGVGEAIGKAPPFTAISSWHVRRVMVERAETDTSQNWNPDALARVWYMPPGTDPLPIAPWVADELQAALAQGLPIALLATSEEAMSKAIAALGGVDRGAPGV